MALLHLTVSRADESVGGNDSAIIEMQWGGQTLTTVGIPVLGVADGQSEGTHEQGGAYATRLPVGPE
ncbi:hypothetical protein GCM10010840_26190 [Deinococcus aerolatus]|uniref:Uncharacterized protein n=1 Tax=Deinococcus aerolatus TaxID=522487 RepID=A0ABQ2GCR1_9DEIO|nr:hypothetical protein [Deinococcus aerolatus]GGL87057.1 hypothetical protein GCM10010840_26190 [Deinococcus aerolatus]